MSRCVQTLDWYGTYYSIIASTLVLFVTPDALQVLPLPSQSGQHVRAWLRVLSLTRAQAVWVQ
jgi:hypothetical protein